MFVIVTYGNHGYDGNGEPRAVRGPYNDADEAQGVADTLPSDPNDLETYHVVMELNKELDLW